MPIYEYECTKCGHRFERLQRVADRKVRTCPVCKGRVQRLFSAPAIRFKGSGWYVNDYSDKGKEARKAESAEKGDKPDKADKKTDKPEPKKKETAAKKPGATAGT